MSTGIDPTKPVYAAGDESHLKQLLYGRFEAGEKWKQLLARKMAFKAVDIVDPELHLEANRTTNNYYAAPGPVAEAVESEVPTPTTQPVARSSLLKMVGKVALGTGLIATGVGVPFGAGMIVDSLLRPVVSTIVEKPGTDTTTTESVDVKARATIEP